MGHLGRLTSSVPPLPPAGGRPFASEDRVADETAGWQDAKWTIRYTMGDQDPTPDRPRVKDTPAFTVQAEAYRYLDCMEKRQPYSYPPGKV